MLEAGKLDKDLLQILNEVEEGYLNYDRKLVIKLLILQVQDQRTLNKRLEALLEKLNMKEVLNV